ncbi:hypothetical protein CEXT_499551 [Caerostris extrusa]|uniref:Uncharacterized protein n=1 Tax=Caerostris extrusa TaxID=172846 RepID=A0AAV4Y9K8_CAEEX|nr:hypothetical protein CEXT_499551 [Caerostris extrusa]
MSPKHSFYLKVPLQIVTSRGWEALKKRESESAKMKVSECGSFPRPGRRPPPAAHAHFASSLHVHLIEQELAESGTPLGKELSSSYDLNPRNIFQPSGFLFTHLDFLLTYLDLTPIHPPYFGKIWKVL